jgi:hypothetical protein
MKSFIISIPQEKIIKMNKASARRAEIELGLRRPVSKVHKSVKDYTRKAKHKTSFI